MWNLKKKKTQQIQRTDCGGWMKWVKGVKGYKLPV